MKKLKASLPIFPGFYGTIFEADEEIIIEDGKTYDDYNWDYPGYMAEVGKGCVNAIEAKLIELGFDIAIKYKNMYSPREYNFHNDAINAIYELKPGCIGKIKAYLNSNLENFAIYLKQHFKSYSGFTSFYTYDVTEWLQFVNFRSFTRDEIYLEYVLGFILTNESYDTMELFYDSVDRYGISIDGWLKDIDPVEDEPKYDFWGDIIEPEVIEIEVFNPNQLVLQF